MNLKLFFNLHDTTIIFGKYLCSIQGNIIAEIKKMYDVLVIGAGPAGCMAAKKSADAGYDVLLVDKMDLPREKSCSGILIQKSVQMVEAEFGKIPE